MGTKPQNFDEYIEQQVTLALTDIELPDGKMLARLRYQIGHMMKDVERDTRHRCAEISQEMHNQIMNCRPV